MNYERRNQKGAIDAEEAAIHFERIQGNDIEMGKKGKIERVKIWPDRDYSAWRP